MSFARRLIRVTLGTALAFAPACADDNVSAAEQAGDGDPGTGDTDELPPELGGPAQGLSIVGVEVNQGTAVDVVRDGELVAVDKRNAKLIRDRDSLVRVHHVIDDPGAWIPRELTGILHVQPADGPELVFARTFFVEADSDPRKLGSSFYFGLLADDARPGSEFWLELRETDGSLDVSSLAAGQSTTPATPFGFEDTPLELRVVLVPVLYEYLDPPRQPDITADDLALFRDFLLQQNPVQTVDLQVRAEPLVRSEQLTNLGSLLSPTREVKLQDGAAANVYYHALVDVGGPSINQVAGIATLTGSSKDDGTDRVAATVYHKHIDIPDEDEEDQTPTIFPPVNSARTFVHEVGHNQGFSHVACPNANAAGPDPAYPYADGKIGAYGFGIRDFHVYTPSASHDYMSYCGNSWVSDWTWNKAFTRIQTLTSWDFEDAGPTPATTPVLVGLLSIDGFEEWSVSTAPIQAISERVLSSASASDWVEYSVAGSLAERVPARVELLSDDTTVMVTAPLPIALVDLDAATWIRGDRRQAVDLRSVRAR